MRIFVTGFGSFEGVEDNPSGWLAENSGHDHQVLPVAWRAADEFLNDFPAENYDALLLLGVAAGRTELTPEFFAYNVNGTHRDVRGVIREGAIDPEGPIKREGTLWEIDEAARWVAEGTTSFSLHPGSYLCNYIFYRALERLPNLKVGFLHVPGYQHLPRETQLDRLRVVIETLQSRSAS